MLGQIISLYSRKFHFAIRHEDLPCRPRRCTLEPSQINKQASTKPNANSFMRNDSI